MKVLTECLDGMTDCRFSMASLACSFPAWIDQRLFSNYSGGKEMGKKLPKSLSTLSAINNDD